MAENLHKNEDKIDYKRKFEALIRIIDRNCYGSSDDDLVPAKYLNRVAREANKLEYYSNYYGEDEEEKERVKN